MTRSIEFRPRLPILIGIASAFAVMPSTAMGAGETYTVVQCHPENLGTSDAEVRGAGRVYGAFFGCDRPENDNAIRIRSRLGAGEGDEASVRWVAPAETGFVETRLEAKLRRDNAHYARIYMADERGRETERIASGDSSPGSFRNESWRGERHEQFVAVLGCDERTGCAMSEEAKTWIRGVRLELADYADPTVSMSGSLIDQGWKRGQQQLTFAGSDEGSGLDTVAVSVNGSPLSNADGTCIGVVAGSSLATRLRPCEKDALGSIGPSTASLPFNNGTNTLSVCGYDFAGNSGCEMREVQVDNSAPSLAFTAAQEPEDPELIHAPVSDIHSGVAGGEISYRAEGETLWQPLETTLTRGELQARVDSVAVPAGNYEFRAIATDVAGNTIETTRRSDGLEMTLAFPLKAGVELEAALTEGGSERATIPYGEKSGVKGVLNDAEGAPLAGQEIVVVEYFGDGALIRERVSRVTTDAAGRWLSKLPAGPSRRVTATYEGTQRYLAESDSGGRLLVRTKARFKPSKRKVQEGNKVVFRGKLGRLGAAVPPGGKLLELQVKQDRKTFQTVGEGLRTNANGRFRVPYRFGTFYSEDVRFTFRVKVAREADWPYKAPSRSKAKKVTVLDR